MLLRIGVCLLICGSLSAASAEEKWRPLFNGKDISGWKVLKESNFKEHGKVAVAEKEIRLAAGDPATGIAYTGKPPRMNYEVQLEAKRTAGDDFFCGLTFPVGKEYCTLIIGGWGGGYTGLSNVDGYSAMDNNTSGYTEFKNKQWYKIRLRVTDDKIAAWIDKEQIVDQSTEDHKFDIWWEQEPARPLGIVTWKSSAALRNIQLRALGKAKE